LVGDSDYSGRPFLGEIYGDKAGKAGKKKSDEQVVNIRNKRGVQKAPTPVKTRQPIRGTDA
jgi:hypothetical protein